MRRCYGSRTDHGESRYSRFVGEPTRRHDHLPKAQTLIGKILASTKVMPTSWSYREDCKCVRKTRNQLPNDEISVLFDKMSVHVSTSFLVILMRKFRIVSFSISFVFVLLKQHFMILCSIFFINFILLASLVVDADPKKPKQYFHYLP